jgi:hypothetical protein
MSQITLTQSPKKPYLQSEVGGEAKDPPPTDTRSNFSWMDAAGLSWILLEDPMGANDLA